MLRLAICDDLPQERERLRCFLESCLARSGYECEITEYTRGEPLAADYEDGGAAGQQHLLLSNHQLK